MHNRIKYAAFFFLLLIMVPASAGASIGQLELMADTTHTLNESFDGLYDKDYMSGVGLRLDFELPLGFSLGLEYMNTSISGDFFETYLTDYEIHSPRISLRWRYPVTYWFEPYLQFAIGNDFHHLRIERDDESLLLHEDHLWKLGIGAMGGFRFMLAKSWVEKMGGWDGFNLGIFGEAGYIYHQPIAVGINSKTLVDSDSARSSGHELGSLNSSGPAWRVGILWRF